MDINKPYPLPPSVLVLMHAVRLWLVRATDFGMLDLHSLAVLHRDALQLATACERTFDSALSLVGTGGASPQALQDAGSNAKSRSVPRETPTQMEVPYEQTTQTPPAHWLAQSSAAFQATIASDEAPSGEEHCPDGVPDDDFYDEWERH